VEILDEIIEWASDLPYWQQIAIVSILSNRIDDVEISSLVEICIKEHEQPDAINELGDPLKEFKYQDTSEEVDGVIITEVHSTQNINAIKDGSKITFGAQGITVVYGSNAVGKSGYSRIFKAACMCRDNEHVHGDIGREDVVDPSAVISFQNGDTSEEFTWSSLASQDPALATVHIFDSRTARIQLTEKNDVKYVPSGLDIFDKLAVIFNSVRDDLRRQIATTNSQLTDFNLIFSDYVDTEAYELVTNLSVASKVEKLRSVTGLSDAETTELSELKKDVRNKETNHPSKRQDLLKLKRERYIKLHNLINAFQRKLSQSTLKEVQTLKDTMIAASKAAETAKKKKFDEKHLPGTGGAHWKILWEAAKDFSVHQAYKNHGFPHTGEKSVCVLCQQPLEIGAGERLKAFEDFITDKSQDLEKKAVQLYNERLDFLSSFEKPIDEESLNAIFVELGSDEYEGVRGLKELLDSCKEEFAIALQKAKDLSSNTIHQIKDLDYSSRDNFRSLIEQMADEIKNFDIAKFTQEINRQKKRISELESRLLLKKYEEQIAKDIANLQKLANLKACLGETDTTAISRKGGDLTNKYLSDNLRNTYADQLKALNRKGLTVELRKSHVERGIPYSEIVITTEANSGNGKYRPDEIMSESEQKIASLAGFFTELSIAPHKSAIILDDPVTSLDELNTARIAKRIVEEAKDRQVIVFTHNLFFTTELINYAESNEVALAARTVTKASYAGQVQDDLPWQALSTAKRIKKLRAIQQDLAGQFRKNQTDEYAGNTKRFYGSLREAWERGVEEVLFQGVVKRYSRAVETQRLKRVVIQDDDKSTIEANMTQCSFYAHDSPDNVDSVEIPEPDQLLEDLEKLSSWVQNIESRSKK
jgi:hypothetical protein